MVTAAALLVAACGGSQDGGEAAPPSPSASTISPSEMTDQQRPADRLTIDISIANGEVTPTNKQVRAELNQPIVLKVTSDTEDELHVHSVPEHTFAVKPGAAQSFQFSVTVPGRVDVELHDAGQTIATIAVQ